MQSLRQSIEESCDNDGASVALDLLAVTELSPEVVADLVAVGDFCRDRGIQLSLSAGDEFLRVLTEAGYSSELLPL
ncbi:MAG: hypothetical protein E6G68_04740 [Actinobacteria bacterium]|nr:MAG: hypothetical protein E6G68_04740 [Actinomycetota bacterium]